MTVTGAGRGWPSHREGSGFGCDAASASAASGQARAEGMEDTGCALTSADASGARAQERDSGDGHTGPGLRMCAQDIEGEPTALTSGQQGRHFLSGHSGLDICPVWGWGPEDAVPWGRGQGTPVGMGCQVSLLSWVSCRELGWPRSHRAPPISSSDFRLGVLSCDDGSSSVTSRHSADCAGALVL